MCGSDLYKLGTDNSTVIINYMQINCYILSEPPIGSDISTLQCYNSIRKCNLTGLAIKHDPVLIGLCLKNSDHPVFDGSDIYRNVYCYLCNQPSLDSDAASPLLSCPRRTYNGTIRNVGPVYDLYDPKIYEDEASRLDDNNCIVDQFYDPYKYQKTQRMFTAIFLLVCIPWISCESGISPTESDTLDLEFLHWKLDVERKSYHETLVLSGDSLNIEDNTSNQDQGEHQNSSIIRPDCLAFLHEFSSQAAGFIKCCINNARPFRFCEGCVTFYTKAVNIYNDIVRNDETLDNCQKILLMSDRVQVINNVKMSIDRIWKDADCANCFKYYTEDVNGTVHAALTDNTLEFLQMYNNFSNCVDIHTTNVSYNATVCKDCLQYYQAMNNKFDDLLNDPVTPRHVCMDMVDMMNYTRLTWGEQLNCTVVHKEYAYVVIVVVVLLGLPVLFYTILSVIGKKKQQMLVKQKRLSPFHHNSYGTLDSPTYHSVDGAGLDGGSSIRRNLSYTSGAQGDNSYNTRRSSQNT